MPLVAVCPPAGACETMPARLASRSAARSGGPMPSNTPEKKAPKAGGGGKANALQKPLQPSEDLAAVVGGPAPLPRSEAVSKV